MSLFCTIAIYMVIFIAAIAYHDRYFYPGHRKQIVFLAVVAVVMIVIFDIFIK